MKLEPNQKLGDLVALRNMGIYGKRTKWEFLCSCGNKFITIPRNVIIGHTISCGCAKHKTEHHFFNRADQRTPVEQAVYFAWCNMLARCNNPDHKSYEFYGGQGITVCESWKNFNIFRCDMGRKPGPEYTLERKDNNGNYEPSNCKWATMSEQNRNKRY